MLAAARAARGRGAPLASALAKTLLWSDEFDGPANSLPAAGNWVYDVGRGTSGWGNSELEYYTANPHNAHLDGNSNLVIAAYHETTPDNITPATPGDTAYTSARLRTQARQTFSPPCKVIARMLVPWTAGLWPALWLMGDATRARAGYTSWPAVGEIDVMEWGMGAAPGVQGNLHIGQVGSLSANIGINAFKGLYEVNPPRWAIYGLDWLTDRLTWHVDGHVVGTVTQAQAAAVNGDWTPLGTSGWPFYLLLNVAVGGSGGGSPTAASAFPQSMLIDWVRVYSL